MPRDDAGGSFTVFVSYAHSDNESPDPSKRWLNRLLEQLQPLVLQNRVGAWSDRQIEAGEQWDGSIKAELAAANVAVLLVSPAFLASKYIRNSELPALLMNAMNRGGTVIPVVVRPCLFAETTFKYPDPARGPGELSLSVFQSANSPDKPLNAMQEHEQDAVLLSVAQRVLELARTKPAAEVPGGGAAAWSVPHPRNRFFTGRAQVLDDLRRELTAGGKAALSGMGGIGKTQTAAEYAYRHRGEYEAVLWAKADGEESLKADLAALAAKLDLPEKDETDRDKAVLAVKSWLEANSGWLLILDNADDLGLVSDLLRREWGGHVLLTTRAYATGGVARVEIKVMTPEEGTLLLLRRAKLLALGDALGAAAEADREQAAKITQEVGGLPLALDQAGAFIEEMASSLGEYLELYRKEGEQLRAERRGGFVADHEPVTITFSLAFRQVASASAAAADMLRVCAFLAPDAIPEEIFISGAPELGENLTPLAGGGINLVKVIGEAGRFSLIRRNAKSGTIEIHRLVQRVLRDEMDAETRRLWAERVVRALNASFPLVNYESWLLCEKLLPHAQEAARLIESYGFDFGEAAKLLNGAGYYCHARAQYAEAETFYKKALSIWERAYGPEHLSVSTSLNNLANLYDIQGKYAEAEPLYLRSLSICEKLLGAEHTDVALTLNNLASLYIGQAKYAEAEPLFVRSLSIREKALGPEHPDVAKSLNNLAYLYSRQGKYADARRLYERALSIREKALGPDDPDLATSLNNLAYLYNRQGSAEKVEQLYERALSIREKTLGPNHPEVAASLNNLARVYSEQGKYAEAEPVFLRALSIYEKAFGMDHPDIAVILGNLAGLCEDQGKYSQAESLYLRALSICEKMLAPEHPRTTLIRQNYESFVRDRRP
ncbi:MAG TPA: FxSxx-COOH system tetratricopeptide repeat protein [Pyrinomonadaceae bacterium]|nr:FxSxx-COOH system tetratricopeptide repeat protein [Pyrinomonadaceae bacterium]